MKKILLLLLLLLPFCNYNFSSLQTIILNADANAGQILAQNLSQIPSEVSILPMEKPVASIPIPCDNIATLRQYAEETIPYGLYQLNQTALVTFISPIAEGYEVYLQDLSGAIRCIFPPELPTFMNIGDELGNLIGSLSYMNSSLTFLPFVKPEIISSHNPVYPQLTDVLTMMLNPDTYESSYVELINVVMNGGGGIFAPGRDYIVYQQGATTALNTRFPWANYIGTTIPSTAFTLSGIVGFNHFTGEVTVTPRSLSDFSYEHGNLSAGPWQADEFYSADQYLRIHTDSRQQVNIYTLLGQLVIQEWVNPGLTQIYIPTTGVYLVQLGNQTKRIAFP